MESSFYKINQTNLKKKSGLCKKKPMVGQCEICRTRFNGVLFRSC